MGFVQTARGGRPKLEIRVGLGPKIGLDVVLGQDWAFTDAGAELGFDFGPKCTRIRTQTRIVDRDVRRRTRGPTALSTGNLGQYRYRNERDYGSRIWRYTGPSVMILVPKADCQMVLSPIFG